MSALAAALDNHTPMKLGENGNPEHAWTHKTDISALVQLYFQLTRCTGPTETASERQRYRSLLQTAFGPKPRASEGSYPPADREFARLLFKLIGHTRDIEAGKGERQITYAFIWEYAQFNVALARYALYSLVHPLTATGERGTGVQFGSWSDIKYFCNAIKEYSGSEDHPLIDYALTLLSEQIREDQVALQAATAAGEKATCSLAVRWMPKENKRTVQTPEGKRIKYGAYTWQYFRLADLMFPYYKTAKSAGAETAARRKARGELHRLYAPINQYLGTVQIAMSAGRKGEGIWDQISFGRGADGSVGKYNVTGCTLRRHPNAWKNVSKDGSDRTEEGHRVQCATNYTEHMEAVSQGTATARGKTLNTYQLAKDAIGTSLSDATEVARINGQWVANSEGAASTGMMLPVIDVSSSMECDDSLPMFSAIGTGIRISEHAHPSLRNRALTFSTTPSWFDLTSCGDDFVKKVHTVRQNSNSTLR